MFHYGIECFEGMKAYKDKAGKIRLFRPDMNMARLLRSCRRLTLPAFDKVQLLECIKGLLKVDERWIPDQRGYSLYIRPTVIGTQESLGVGPSNRATIFVIACPVGPYVSFVTFTYFSTKLDSQLFLYMLPETTFVLGLVVQGIAKSVEIMHPASVLKLKSPRKVINKISGFLEKKIILPRVCALSFSL